MVSFKKKQTQASHNMPTQWHTYSQSRARANTHTLKSLTKALASKLRIFRVTPRLTRITGLLSGRRSLKCGGDTERSEALKQSIFKMAASMLHV